MEDEVVVVDEVKIGVETREVEEASSRLVKKLEPSVKLLCVK